MDFMMLGETLGGAADTEYLGFWMPTAGNDGVAAIEVFARIGSDPFRVDLVTKSSDEADASGTSIGSVTISSGTPQVHRFGVSGAKDLVRYMITCADPPGSFLHFQLLPPAWAPN